jgi:imidazolonepropionase-like amidohydrolase
MKLRGPGWTLAVLCGAVAAAAVQSPAGGVYAIRGARVFTLAGPPLDQATVLIRDGKIAAVGTSVEIPPDATVVDGRGLQVYPGIFDSITQMGLVEIPAVRATVDTVELGAFNPEVVAADAVNPTSEHIFVTRAEGITHVLTVPGLGGFGGRQGNLLGGQASAIELDGWTNEQMVLERSVALVVNWPSLESRSFNPETFNVTQRPFAEVRREYERRVNELADWVEKARHYAQAREQLGPSGIERDLKLEALVPFVEGRKPLLVVANSARDIRNAVEFCQRHNLKMILAGGAEAYQVKELLAKQHIPVVLGSTLAAPAEEDDPYDRLRTQPAELLSAGIPIALASFSTSDSRRLPQYAGTAVGFGLSWEDGVKAITLYPAQIFGLSGELGTIEPGKRANLVVTDGDLLEIARQVRYVFINGRPVSLDNRQLELYRKYRARP